MNNTADSTVTYDGLDRLCERLDGRALSYRFDLESDMPWEALDAPGLYAPPALLALFGIDDAALAREPEAHALFQWAYALSICRTFELLEWGIIQFARAEAPRLGASRSIDDLRQEEGKHIKLFRRISNHLQVQRPEQMPSFERGFEDSYRFLRTLFDGVGGPDLHYRMYLTTMLFEPTTVLFGDWLTDAEEHTVQPVWLRAHALHAQEEREHVTTISSYAEHLQLDEAARAHTATLMTEHFQRGFRYLLGLEAPLRLVAEQWPELGEVSHPVGDIPPRFATELRDGALFQPLRRAMPELRLLF